MHALNNGMQASTVELIYTSNYVQHLLQLLVRKKFLSQTGECLAESVKKRKKGKYKIQIILKRSYLISYYNKLLSSSELFT